ncbi:MAG: glutamine synthetase [Alphaproteobacteria bacterium]|jgi:glutamine synthetase|nr:glutamine synthetase [Alphaproteobacteria bacterium]
MSSSEDRSAAQNFIERHGLWSGEQFEAAARAERLIESERLEVVRLSFPDQHGILRGKQIMAGDAAAVMRNGCSITTTLLAKDTSQKSVFPVFTSGGGFGMRAMEGGADFLMIADPTTFRVLPWAPQTGWVLCDIYFPDGRPVPFSTRHLYRRVLHTLGEAGFDYMAGLEVEFHIFKLDNPRIDPSQAAWPPQPPAVSLISPGYAYLTETRFDQMEPILEAVRRDVVALGLPLRSVEIELGPSQCEFTFHPQVGLAPADTMMLFRSAVKQSCRRQGFHASFMCRPKLPHALSSGWHLHQSLLDRNEGGNAFMAADEGPLSQTGRHFLGGLLAHARAATAFATPTINGYKRYRSYALAPDRVIWGHDNRGVMIRALGGAGDPATRLENRVGEPAANPYLYMAAQIVTGLDGMARALDPGPSADTPYETAALLLPRSLEEALQALREDQCLADGFGQEFIDYYLRLKEAEVARYQSEVTEWEQREYFELF